MGLRRIAARALLAALCCACGAGESSAPGAQRVVLGTGEAAFEPIEGEPWLPLVAGSQGGFHVWASFLAYGFESTAVDLTLTTKVEGAVEDLVMRARITTREVTDPDGVPARGFAGFPAQVRDARCADGSRVALHLSVAAPGDDHAASDERHVNVSLDPEFRLDECP